MAEITYPEVLEKTEKRIKKGYKGKAIVAFVDILGFSEEIKTSWDDPDIESNPLQRIMELKEFVLLARDKVKNHILHDYDEKTVVAQAPYPDIITLSDSFVFIQKVDVEKNGAFISALLSITFNILELWRISIDNGFTLRGGVDYGGLFYSEKEIIGPPFIEAVRLESSVADISRIVYSHTIRKMIYERHQSVPAIIQDYILRYFRKDLDSFIILNPVMLSAPNDFIRN